MSNIADLYKKKQREREKEKERESKEKEERWARQVAEAAQRAEEIRQQEAKSLTARKRVLRESGLLNMLEELKRRFGLAYTIDHQLTAAEITVGEVGTKEIQDYKTSERTGQSFPVGQPEKWKVIYGAEILVFEDKIRVKDSTDYRDRWFSATEGWQGLEEAIVDAVQIGLKSRREKKRLRKTFLGL